MNESKPSQDFPSLDQSLTCSNAGERKDSQTKSPVLKEASVDSSNYLSESKTPASDSVKRRRLYSRRGDLGETSLCFGPRVGKDQLRIVACGTLDELNSFLGLARSEGLFPKIDRIIDEIQKKIFDVSAELMTLNPSRHEISTLQISEVQTLESLIDFWDNQLPPLTQFILPGGCRSAATLHVARAVCRRAERQAVALLRKDETVSRIVIAWLNRLSDLIFVLARTENSLKQTEEVKIVG